MKLDWKKDCKALYFPPARPVMVEVPPINYLMIDGHGDPNHSPLYQEAVEALFTLAYTLKFAIKKAEGIEYAVYPAEGLWWVLAATVAIYAAVGTAAALILREFSRRWREQDAEALAGPYGPRPPAPKEGTE